MKSREGIIIVVLVLFLVGLGFYFRMNTKTVFAPQDASSSATTATTSSQASAPAIFLGPTTIGKDDNGKTFSYVVTSRFMVKLPEDQYSTDFSCAPEGILGRVANVLPTEDGFVQEHFETVKEGTCTLSNGNFSVKIIVTNHE